MEKETNFDPKTLFFGLAWVIESDNFVFNYLDDLEIIRIEITLESEIGTSTQFW